MHIIGFIPARGGSTRLPNKNLAVVGDRTLVQRAIDSARDAGIVPVVSSQDAEILAHAVAYGCMVHERPPHLSTERALVDDAILHWFDRARRKPDAIALLNPTSPFRNGQHVEEALALLLANGADSVVSVTLGYEPYFGGVIGQRSGADIWTPTRDTSKPRPRTQDLGKMGHENGAIFGFTRAHWLREPYKVTGGRAVAYAMPKWSALDIDTQEDLDMARAIVAWANRDAAIAQSQL